MEDSENPGGPVPDHCFGKNGLRKNGKPQISWENRWFSVFSLEPIH